MTKFDKLPILDAIRLYYEKHHALRQGDIATLVEMKKQYPEIFDKELDRELSDIITYAKEFQKSARYKALNRLAMKEKLSVIRLDD